MANASVTLGVSGVAQFKQSMNEAKAASKALDSELKQAEAAFKAGGDAQDYLASKSDLTRQKMAELKKVIDNAEKAMNAMAQSGDTSSTAYQQMRKQAADAKTEMISLENAVDDTGDSMADASEKTGGFSNILGKLTVAGVAVGVITAIGNAAKSAAEGLWNFGKAVVSSTVDAAQQVDDLATSATRYRMSMQELQKSQLASLLMDADFDAIVKARSRILDDATKSTNGVITLDADTSEFDVWVVDNAGKMRDIQDIFWDTVEALGRMENPTKRDAKAMELFGRSYLEVATLFEEGARDRWNEILNGTAANTDEEFKKLNDLNDELDTLRYNVTVAKYAALSSIAPAFETGAEAINGFLERLNVFTRSDTGQKFFEGLNTAVTTFFDNITDEDIDAFFTKLQEEIFPNIISWLDTLPDKVQTAIDSIGGITGALEKVSNYVAWISEPQPFNKNWKAGADAWAEYVKNTPEMVLEVEKAKAYGTGIPSAGFSDFGNWSDFAKFIDAGGLANLTFGDAGTLAQFGFGTNAKENIRIMQEYDESVGVAAKNAEDYIDLANSVATIMALVPDETASAIEAGIPNVEAAASAMGAAMVAAAAAGAAAGVGGTTTNNNQTYTFNVSDNVDMGAVIDQMNAQNQAKAAGYGG